MSWLTSLYSFMVALLRVFFGIQTLVYACLCGLLGVSAFATLKGILDFVQAETGATPDRYVLVGAVAGVFLATVLMWLALERVRLRGSRTVRLFSATIYLFLLIWSVGFGYGFWWSLLAARADTDKGLDTAIQSITTDLAITEGRLTAIKQRIATIADTAKLRQQREDQQGGSCGESSGGGKGRRWRARTDVTDQLTNLTDHIQTDWIAPLQKDLTVFKNRSDMMIKSRGDLSSEDRRLQFTALFNDIRSMALRINESSSTRARGYRAELEQAVKSLRVPPENAAFRCFDPGLATQVEDAASEIGDPPLIREPTFKFAEGAKATEEAFLRLWGNTFAWLADTTRALLSPMLPAARIIPEPRSSLMPLTDRDWIALMATVVVDIGIIFLTLIRPHKPLASFLGAQGADGNMRRFIKRRWTSRAREAHDFKSQYVFKHGDDYYIALPTRKWSLLNSNGATTKVGLLENLLLPLDSEGFVNIIRWPLWALAQEATLVLQEAGWKKNSRWASPRIYHLETKDLDALDEEVEFLRGEHERSNRPLPPLPGGKGEMDLQHNDRQVRRRPWPWFARDGERDGPANRPQPPVNRFEPKEHDRGDEYIAGRSRGPDRPVESAASIPSRKASSGDTIPGQAETWLDHLSELDRQIIAAEEMGTNASVVEGMRLNRLKLEAQLATAGYQAFGRSGEIFDRAGRLHDAVATRASERPKGEILEVLQLGFIYLRDETSAQRILRPARVIVSSGPAQAADASPSLTVVDSQVRSNTSAVDAGSSTANGLAISVETASTGSANRPVAGDSPNSDPNDARSPTVGGPGDLYSTLFSR